MQLTKKCPKYTYRKDGVYYFSNAVPKDLCYFANHESWKGIVKTWSRSPQLRSRLVARSPLWLGFAASLNYWFTLFCLLDLIYL